VGEALRVERRQRVRELAEDAMGVTGWQSAALEA